MIDRRLVYVVSTARYGSFTAAAERVGVTQSAITRSVADLELELGYSIFNRTARGVLMTEEGRSFVDRASRILEDARELFGGTSSETDRYAGALRIGVCPASVEWMLLEPLSVLMKQHPRIRLEISGGSFDRVVQQLRVGAIDVAVGYEAAFEGQPDFRRETLPPLRTAFFARKGHPIFDCEEVTTAEIAKYDLISPSGSPPYDLVWQKMYQEAGIDEQIRLHIVDSFSIVTRLVHETDAISLVSTQFAESSYFQSRFACVPYLDTPLPPAPFCCATRLRWSPRPAVRAFINACRERFPASG